MECYSCEMPCDQVVNKMYYEELRYIHQRLNSDTVSMIQSYLYYVNGHDVIHDEKELVNENDPESDHIERRYTDVMCTFCFQKGLALCLQATKELPYLRKDFRYFCSDEPIFGLKQQFNTFILPNTYKCTYYASSFMYDDENGITHIEHNRKN